MEIHPFDLGLTVTVGISLFYFQGCSNCKCNAFQVRSAFENQSTGPLFNLADNLVSASRGRGQGRGRGSSRGRDRGRGSGSTTTNSYSFGVILLNPEQTSIPRGSNRSELERSGSMKTFEISRGAPASTTFRKLTELFPDLNR